MRLFPIIPIWIMFIICFFLIFITLKYNKKSIVRIFIIIIVFIINLRIMIPGNGSETISNDLDVLFVIDSTISMNALDYNNGTRLSAVKEDCKYIVDKLDGSRFSVVTFDNNAKIVIPFTYDTNITLEALDLISVIGETYAKGSSLNKPIDTMKDLLDSSMKNNEKSRIVFFISDGEITNEDKLESYKGLAKYINGGYVLGYGTTSGGYMKNKNKYTEEETYLMYYENGKYDKAVSKIDEKNLKKIARDMGIDYIKMNSQNDIEKKINSIKNNLHSKISSTDKSTYKDTYYLLIIPLIILLIIEFNNVRSRTI